LKNVPCGIMLIRAIVNWLIPTRRVMAVFKANIRTAGRT
jgi:hypothetical protein